MPVLSPRTDMAAATRNVMWLYTQFSFAKVSCLLCHDMVPSSRESCIRRRTAKLEQPKDIMMLQLHADVPSQVVTRGRFCRTRIYLDLDFGEEANERRPDLFVAINQL